MKKLLMLILIALLVAFSIFLFIQGVHIGSFEIPGIKIIQEKDDELDAKIQQAGKLAEKDYKQAVGDVTASSQQLKQQKKNYEDMTAISTDAEGKSTNQIEKYEIETLWVRLGNHATSQGVVMQMDVIKGNSSTQDMYNLKFTATGSYISITDFISAIENDSTLGFKIEEFKMNPSSSGSDLQATFVCKDIAIKDVSQSTTTTPSPSTDTSTNKNNTTNNTTNNTNSNSTSNTSNSTNTTNTSSSNAAR